MIVAIGGIDGYIGWALALHLAVRGHKVVGIDNFITRKRVEEVGSWSATPILTMQERIKAAKEVLGVDIQFVEGDLVNYSVVRSFFEKYKPDAFVHLAEQRSAPYSMIDVYHAVETQTQNIASSLNIVYAMKEVSPHTHLVKMGTMGEYGTPNIDIPEGFFEVEYHGRKDYLPFPRMASSWYHWSKVHDSGNMMFANKIWGLKISDVMQGVVYGTRTNEIVDERLHTRFDFDEVWGTALNRFCVQTVLGLPMTVYGKGGQTRGFISLTDSVQCLRLIIENPPDKGEYRVFNQFDEPYSVLELAQKVYKVGKEMGFEPAIAHVPNPRVEAESHYYNPEHEKLKALGFKRTRELEEELRNMLRDLSRYKNRLEAKKDVIFPRTDWRRARNPVR
ncbi:NAD-dependent dehydratase [Candidatus Marsarchaeota G1 archaeon BE_D]|jgi:UDP-sulfoquinovose synthase|uniref:NAD-dependent dehydratase n=1 Tax=Candidatus Marsarchaeota G1 archaeon BE_D TaxID=1978156 RepID=A0A2R6AGV2_9ARCH|nr:MAG: NAD-dependent dehydratase [Candidatus Marsarchaeota G1 archaeon BE_D]